MKLKEVYYGRLALNELEKQDFPITTAFKISKLISVTETDYALTEKARTELVEKYGEKKEDSDVCEIVDNSKANLFVKEFMGLLEKDVDINFEKLTLKELEGIKIKPISLKYLSGFIEEKGDDQCQDQ